jgi:3-phenylpropionate/trans-cinnamate dioxygenase ferredoxin reductase subunit
MPKAYVIVGASLAGASAAVTLREEGFDGAVIVIGAECEAPYERPPLSKAYLRGDVPFEKALVRPPIFYDEHRIEIMLGTRVTRVDTTQRVVELADRRQVPFDALLLATGARNRILTTPGAVLEGIYSLRTIHDADRIRAEMRPGRRAVIVGMGFIGSEVAASLRQAGVDVVTVDPGKTPLFRVLGETVGAALAALHRAHGVRTVFEDSVAAFEGERRVALAITKAGQRLECDFVVAGVGVEPQVDMLADSGIRIDNGVVVDEYCQTNVSGVFAAGDVANHYQPLFGRHIRIEHWQNAIKQGAAAARNMLGHHVPYDEVPWFWSDQYDVNLQYAGFHTKWDQLILRGRVDAGSFLACYINDGRIDAVVGFNRGKDVRRAMTLIKDRRAVSLEELADDSVDLRSMSISSGPRAPL